MKPVVLVLTSTFPRWQDDTEPRFVFDLCKELSDRFEILVLAPHCPGAKTEECFGLVRVVRFRYFIGAAETLAYDGGMLPKVRARPLRWLLVPFFLIAQTLSAAILLRRYPVALIHAHWLIPQGLCAVLARALAFRRLPLVCTAHGADVFALRGRLLRWLQKAVVQRSAVVGAVSEAIRDELVLRGDSSASLEILPMGVTLAGDGSGSSSTERRQQIAFAGRLVEKKGVDVLIKAFARLIEIHPGYRLIVAGDGPCRAALQALAQQLHVSDRVDFLGSVPHEGVLSLFRSSQLAVVPSVVASDGDTEGLGLVMLEAMASGCPVVASHLPAIRTVIRHEHNGLLATQGDAAALTACILQLVCDEELRVRLARAGRETVETRFGWRQVGERYRGVFDRILSASQKKA